MKILMDVTPVHEDGSCGGAVNICYGLIDGFLAVPDVSLALLCRKENRVYLEGRYADRVVYCEADGDGTVHEFSDDRKNAGTASDRAEIEADIVFYPLSAPNLPIFAGPSVSTIHDIQHEYYPEFFSETELQARRQFYRNIVQGVDAAVCVSDFTRKTFCERYGYPEEKAVTVYNAIQNRFSGVPDMSLLKKFGVEEGEYIFYPANFWPHKNHEALIRAFAVYAGENSAASLVFSGNMLGNREHFEELLAQKNLTDRVRLVGYVSEEEMFALYAGSCGVIYPSLFEGFGIPVAEAMYLNKLVACSNLTSLPEVGGDAVYYFDPNREEELVSAIRYLFSEKMTPEIQFRYQQRLQLFSNEQMIRGYLEIFQKLIEEYRPHIEKLRKYHTCVLQQIRQMERVHALDNHFRRSKEGRKEAIRCLIPEKLLNLLRRIKHFVMR